MNCKICNREMSEEDNCGGDCVQCMAEAGNPECIELLRKQGLDICHCGSGLPAWWEYDAQGIPLCKVCDKCRKEKLSKYRPCILEGYDQSDVDEPIEED